MILKVGKGDVMPTKIFAYIEGCEEVKTYRMNLSCLLKIWSNRFTELLNETVSIQDLFKRQKIKEENTSTNCNINYLFCRQLLEIYAEELNIPLGITDDFELQKIVDGMLGDECVNVDWFDRNDLIGVGYIKDGQQHLILAVSQPIYLLNNEGKTIDIIK